MNIDNSVVSLVDLQNAVSQLPSGFVPVDDAFLETYKEPIGVIKEHFKNKGGILVLEVDEFSGIFRIPSQKQYSAIQKRAKSLDAFDADLHLVGDCLLYPKIEVIQKWIESGYFGVVSSFALAIVKETKSLSEATVKKI